MRYAFMEPVIDIRHATRYSAVDISCPSCPAEAGIACAGPRVCPARVQAALDLLRAGGLAEAPAVVVAKQANPNACTKCGLERTQRGGHPVACDDPAHRCQWLTGGSQCRRVAEPGSRWCSGHGRRRWNG